MNERFTVNVWPTKEEKALRSERCYLWQNPIVAYKFVAKCETVLLQFMLLGVDSLIRTCC